MTVAAIGVFTNACIKGKASFRDAKFATLDLSLAFWPSPAADSIALDGLTYERISARGERDVWHTLRNVEDRSVYRPDVYSSLETFLKKQGYSEEANEVFYAKNKHELQEAGSKGLISGVFTALGNWFLFYTCRYGRHPELAFAWSGVFVLLGYIVFRDDKRTGQLKGEIPHMLLRLLRFLWRPKCEMEPQRPDDTIRIYNAFWYSLDLFAPIIDLQSANYWKPNNNNRFARHYMRLHRILGWIMVPIAVAALSGFIK